MKVLWVLYEPIGRSGRILNGSASQSGTWIDATTDLLLRQDSTIELAIAAIHSQTKKIADPADPIVYYGVGGVRRLRGKSDARTALASWTSVVEDFRPDVIQLWGIEYANGIDVIEAAKGIPIIIYIQGVMRAIAKYPNGGLPLADVRRAVSLPDKLKCFKLMQNQRAIERQVAYEAQMVSRAKNLIVDSDWCEAQYRTICPDVNAYRLVPVVNQAFLKARWDWGKASGNTIFCIAGRTPYKGLHQAIRAMAIVKRHIPDARLVIPGDMSPQGLPLLTRSPYLAYLDRLIDQADLRGSIEFCGQLDSDQMARKMLEARAFIMPSCIENYSTTLREAMYLGMPCISAFTGSVSALVEHGRNGLLFRYEEFDDLAALIIRTLTQPEMAVRLASRAYGSIREKFPQGNIGVDLIKIYQGILEAGRSAKAAASDPALNRPATAAPSES